MVSVRRIDKGEEVFNTYGQVANWQLLHMYGFTESYLSNINDTADIPVSCLHQAAKQGDKRLYSTGFNVEEKSQTEPGPVVEGLWT